MNGKHLEQVYEVISRMYVALDFIDCWK
jgi:hypothetical protein